MGIITGTPDFTEGFVNSGLKHLEYYQSANSSSYATATAQTIIYNTQHKLNGFTTEYNNTTGIFTASEGGYYLVHARNSINSDTAGELRRSLTYISINGTAEDDITADIFFNSDQDLNGWSGGSAKLIELSSSDTIRIRNYVDTNTGTWRVTGTTPTRRTYLTITKIG